MSAVAPAAWTRYLIRYLASGYIIVMLIVPVSLILWRTFRPGFHQFYIWITTPAAISALQLSLLVLAIVVPLNVLFGVPAALLVARNHFRGKGVLQSIIDLPFAVSPIIVGVALISAWGSAGALGFIERDTGVRIIFGVPRIVLASIFVTLPFVVREVKLVLTRGPSRSKRRRRWVRVGGRRSCASPCRRSGGAWPTAWC